MILLRCMLGFVASAALMALAIVLGSKFPPRYELTVMTVGFAIAGAVAGASLEFVLSGSYRLLSMLCSPAGFALSGAFFVVLTAAEAKPFELIVASAQAWAPGGLLIGLGFSHFDRRAWLTLLGPLVFGASGAMSRWVLDRIDTPELAFIAASFVVTVFGGGLFATVAVLLRPGAAAS